MEGTTARAVAERRRALQLQRDSEQKLLPYGAIVLQNNDLSLSALRSCSVSIRTPYRGGNVIVDNGLHRHRSEDRPGRCRVQGRVQCDSPLCQRQRGSGPFAVQPPLRVRRLPCVHRHPDVPPKCQLKWLATGVSHTRGFATFPTGMPRDADDKDVKECVVEMVLSRCPCVAIEIDKTSFAAKASSTTS